MLEGAALVTGGAKRIGATIARTLAEAGATVVVHARNSTDEAERLAEGLDGAAIKADLADPAAVAKLADAAEQAAGAPLRYVVNNASFFPQRSLQETTYDDLDHMMRLHAWAPLVLARDLARKLGPDHAADGGVVNMLDTRITSHDPHHFPYLMSKQTLGQLTRSLAKELAPLRVNGVAPGPILEPTDGSDDTSLDAAVRATVLKRKGEPEEIAQTVRFLLEDRYVTGNIVFVDGGRHLRT